MFKERMRMIDKWLFIPFVALLLFSIVIVYSASTYSTMEDHGQANYYLIRQTAYVLVSFIVATIAYFLSLRLLKGKKFIQYATIIILILLIWVLFTPEVLGASRWIRLPGFNIQPAEFAKIFVILYLAYIFSRNQEGIETRFKKIVLRPGALVAFIAALVLIQPDTGTFIIISAIILLLLFSSGISLRYGFIFFTVASLLILLAVYIIYNFGEHLPFLDYRYERFLGWFDPFGNYETEGHQLVNSYYALNRGGMFGVGIGNSVQKTGYLPFPYTDFILAIVGEELGLAGIAFVLGSLGLIIGRSFYIGSRSEDSFVSLLCLGVGGMLLVQSLVNMAGVTGLLPITGVTFPFLSYGGSSLLTVSVSVALVANVSTLEKMKNKIKKT